MAVNRFGNPVFNGAAVVDVPVFNDTEVDVAPRAKPSSCCPRGVAMVDDFSLESAYAARGFNVSKILRVVKAVLALDSILGLVAGIAQSYSVFRLVRMIDTAFLGSIKSVEAKA